MAPLFVNNYKPGSIQSSTEPITNPWNFILPVPECIETSRVKLVPFVPSIHVEPWHAVIHQNPTFMQYVPFKLDTLEDIFAFYRTTIHDDPHNLSFAIINKTGATSNDDGAPADGTMAGIIGAVHCIPQHLKVEIGPVIIFPAYQGTHVTKHAIGAMLKYWLDVPSQGGMGFRRVAWTANPMNKASIRIAEKMGFKREGEMRWTWVLVEGKPGKDVDVEGDRGVGKGRDTAVLSLCCDDWEDGLREQVLKLIET